MRRLAIGIAVLLAVVLIWNLIVYKKLKDLGELAKQFNDACQVASGCIIIPAGWESSRLQKGTSYKDGMEYVATKESFEIRWHIAPETWLVAKGGKGREIDVARTFD